MRRSAAIFASYLGVLLYAGLVFIGAGRLSYWQGFLYLALAFLGTTINHLLMPAASDLTARRVREAGSGESWDKRLLGAFFLVNTIMFLIAGMDSGRYCWSGPVPLAMTVTGAFLMTAGQVVFALAKRENAFFSSTVQIQAGLGHRVCETGPYRRVRHPGYAGMLLSLVAFPLVMGSYWSVLPALGAMALLVVRTLLEDRFLLGALPGYGEYAAKTRYRLIPGVF